MKLGNPIPLREKYYSPIEKTINAIFYEIIYAPLVKILEGDGVEVLNAGDPISEALGAGKIYFEDGIFKGSFDAKISKYFKQMGAKWSMLKRGFTLDEIPVQIQFAIASAENRYRSIMKRLIAAIDSIDVLSVMREKSLDGEYIKTIDEMDKQFHSTLKAITIVPKIDSHARKVIAQEWGKNLELYIVDWTKQNIFKLREEVMQSTLKGRRSSSMVKTIQENYQVSRDKAKFLARQETSLLLSQMREVRYKDSGSEEYKWRGSMDERERPDHRALEGTVHRWDSPPITNKKTGARNNPGEDFGCRCVAIPIFR